MAYRFIFNRQPQKGETIMVFTGSEMKSAWVDHIPVIWFKPGAEPVKRRLAICLTGLSGTKEDMIPRLEELAGAGLVALSFDAWMHGERTTLPAAEVLRLTFSNFRRHMWVNLGQTAMDTLRVIDWAINELGVEPEISMLGISMGGDIAVAAAGIDRRIQRVGAVVATPDWLRPGMADLFSPTRELLPPGAPDAYSLLLYERFNPITHLASYAHGPEIRFICGEKDDHVPPEAAIRFKAALAEIYPQAAEKVTITLVPGYDHLQMAMNPDAWWPELLDWLKA